MVDWKAWSMITDFWLPGCSRRYYYYSILTHVRVHRLRICCLLPIIGTKNSFWNIKIAHAWASAIKIHPWSDCSRARITTLGVENWRWRGVEARFLEYTGFSVLFILRLPVKERWDWGWSQGKVKTVSAVYQLFDPYHYFIRWVSGY